MTQLPPPPWAIKGYEEADRSGFERSMLLGSAIGVLSAILIFCIYYGLQ